MDTQVPNPLEPNQAIKRPLSHETTLQNSQSQPVLPEDSAVTKAEKVVGSGTEEETTVEEAESPVKRRKLNSEPAEYPNGDARDKVKGIALVKAE
jgi:tRNA-dihydrouridine synthase 3